MNNFELDTLEVLERAEIYRKYSSVSEELPEVKVKYTLIEE
ncbi:MAG: hypothetical protein RL204_95 [Bacteroidota bacterium]|jgi:hypothetical protein